MIILLSITTEQYPMIILILAVAVLAFILSLIGIMSFLNSRDRRILFVASAFGIFFIKNSLVFISLLYDIFPHTNLESIEALFDLVTLILLLVPVLKKDI